MPLIYKIHYLKGWEVSIIALHRHNEVGMITYYTILVVCGLLAIAKDDLTNS